MRLAFISDIHGNLLALQAIWQDIQRRKVDKVLCAGDLISFGPRPAEVLDFFCTHDIDTILGNHDATVIGKAKTDSFVFKNDCERQYIEDSIARTMMELKPEYLEYLSGLQNEIRLPDCSLVMTHSVPDMFAYPKVDAMDHFMADREERFLFYGHTHRFEVHTLMNGKLAVNIPGLGKPKHGDPLAGYCIAEIESGLMRDLQFLFVDYDRQAVCNEILERDFPAQTIQFLQSGGG